MTLPVGTISLAEVNVELGYSSTALISLNDTAVRTLAGVPSGQISMQNLQGKANQFAFTISSNQTNANLATLATAAGWNGSSKLVATISSGVYISSNSTGTPALTVNGSFPGGVELTNNGYIIGMGGAGGNGVTSNDSGVTAGTVGGGGGTALAVTSNITITNNGTIGGGGGGGGGGQGAKDTSISYGGTGGGGGGGGSTGTTNSAGGSAGGSGYRTITYPSNGVSGTSSSAGSGGAGGANRYYVTVYSGAGGNGGTWGASGVTGANASGGARGSATSGGSGGACLTGNSYITWVSTGTRYGSIS